MNPKFCPQCGNPLSEGSAFCGKCGWKIEQENPVPPPETKTEFNSFSNQMTDDTYNIRNQRAGYGLGVVVILMILAVIGYFVIEVLK